MGTMLRHAHLAVRKSVEALAHSVQAPVFHGEDELGEYTYFDIVVSHEDGSSQTIRFASHHSDSLTHILAENIEAVSDLAGALFAVGFTQRSHISISTNQFGKPVRSLTKLKERLEAMSKSSSSSKRKKYFPIEIVSANTKDKESQTSVILH